MQARSWASFRRQLPEISVLTGKSRSNNWRSRRLYECNKSLRKPSLGLQIGQFRNDLKAWHDTKVRIEGKDRETQVYSAGGDPKVVHGNRLANPTQLRLQARISLSDFLIDRDQVNPRR